MTVEKKQETTGILPSQNILEELYRVILARRAEPVENSYTNYLFDAGLNKILKKCAEESGEVLIAAKDSDKPALIEEICDLTYHLLVLMAEQEIMPSDIEEVLRERSRKIGNRKPTRESCQNS